MMHNVIVSATRKRTRKLRDVKSGEMFYHGNLQLVGSNPLHPDDILVRIEPPSEELVTSAVLLRDPSLTWFWEKSSYMLDKDVELVPVGAQITITVGRY
jgi:hypothetical protein